MATLALKTYLSQIEELTDNGETAEALAHCRHILEHFPKNIATYRAMAKAYLEDKQYAEASDIFQRVLSSVPDDFVAHIGMSIIREEDGDQNGAIWHMERAFEAQPSNRAVQDELRRLYSEREGYALPKVRLTRGALARMYAHGDLFNQAISELRSALAEDPQRPDLQVLLAEMLLKSQNQSEAVEICGQLIEKFPYCLFANQVMADILSREQRDVEAAPYLERIEELDPYARQSASGSPTDSVLLEKLSTSAASPTSAAEDEAALLEEDLPDWLSVEAEEFGEQDPGDAEEEANQPKETSPLLADIESMAADSRPDESEQLELYGKTNTAALVDDQVPDWLRGLTPVTSTLSEDPEPTLEPRKLSWTEELRSAGLQPTALPEDQELSQEEAPVDEPSEAEATEQAAPAEDEESLRWLESLAAGQGAQEDELLTTPEERQQASPEWAPQAEAPAEPKSDTLAWLDDIERRQEAGLSGEDTPPAATPWATQGSAGDEAESAEAAAQADDIFADAPFSAEIIPEETEPAPEWLRELSSEVAEDAPERTPEPKALGDTPDWLNELRYQTGELSLPETENGSPSEEDAVEAGATTEDNQLSKLDWLDELGPPSHQPPPSSAWVPEAELEEGQGLQPSPDAAAPAEAAEDQETPDEIDPWETLEDEPELAAVSQLAAEPQGDQLLAEARQALNAGDQRGALQQYEALLRSRKQLPEVIADLRAIVSLQPDRVELWQALGDAYMRNNQLREALDCYTKAEDLL